MDMDDVRCYFVTHLHINQLRKRGNLGSIHNRFQEAYNPGLIYILKHESDTHTNIEIYTKMKYLTNGLIT